MWPYLFSRVNTWNTSALASLISTYHYTNSINWYCVTASGFAGSTGNSCRSERGQWALFSPYYIQQISIMITHVESFILNTFKKQRHNCTGQFFKHTFGNLNKSMLSFVSWLTKIFIILRLYHLYRAYKKEQNTHM